MSCIGSSRTHFRGQVPPLHLQLETKILLLLQCRLFRHADKCSMPIQARSVILLFQVPLLTFQWLGPGLGPNSDLGLNKSTDQTKIEFLFMASLHKFFLQFIHSHTFRSSLSSANQLPEVIPVQLSSRLHVSMIRKEPDHQHVLELSRGQSVNSHAS